MQKEELSYQKYEFIFRGGESNTYTFETKNEVFYEIKFKPTPYIFEDPSFASNTYEFSIIVAYTPTGISPTFDPRTSHTIAAIFTDFYVNNDELITIYICESADGRQLVRKRKFDSWFQFFEKEDFIKYEDHIIDNDGEIFPIAVIIKAKNPYKALIITNFIQLIEGYNVGK